MTDIFQEVDEEVRRERLQQFWNRYGHLVVAACIAIVAAVAGFRGWQWYEAKKAAETGAAFDAAAQLARDGKHAESAAAFAELTTDGIGASYRMLARMRQAEELATRDRTAAITAFDAVAADGSADKLFREVARVRAAMLLVDTAPLADLTGRLEPLVQAGGAFRHTGRELLALAAYRAGDMAAARRFAEAATADPDAPASLKARLDILLAITGESPKT